MGQTLTRNNNSSAAKAPSFVSPPSSSSASSFIPAFSSYFHKQTRYVYTDPTSKCKADIDVNNCLLLLQTSLLGLKRSSATTEEAGGKEGHSLFALHNENKQSCLGFICENWFCLTNSKQGRRQVLEQLSEQGLKELLLSDGLRVSSEWECLLLAGSWAVLQLKKEDLRKEKEELLLQHKKETEKDEKGKDKGKEKESIDSENRDDGEEKKAKEEQQQAKKIDLRATRGRFGNTTTLVVGSQLGEETEEEVATTEEEEISKLPFVEEERPFIYNNAYMKRLSEKMLPLMGCIRFPMMSDFQLLHLESETDLIPVELLTEAIKHRLNILAVSPSVMHEDEQKQRRRRPRDYKTVKWDCNRKHNTVLLSDGCNTARVASGTTCDIHRRTVIGSEFFVSGQASWTIEAVTDANCHSAVGVVGPSFNVENDMMGVAEGSWALCVYPGGHHTTYSTSRRNTNDLGSRLLKGGTIQVELDLDIGLLRFHHNGKVVWTCDGVKGPLYPAITLCHGPESYKVY
ncbi:Duffy receptor beta form [Balamuthia mandrillaris]